MAPPPPSFDTELVRIGGRRQIARDLYHFLLTTSWLKLMIALTAAYVASNALFALVYLCLDDGIENVRQGSFADAFYFSVQTMATIGYGKMVPKSPAAHVLVAVEAFVGMFGMAMATGLAFAKFSKPTARVLFSNVAVISDRNGLPCLMFRMANERHNQILEAQIHVVLMRDERTAEGETFRRMHDLKLQRNTTPLFALTWTAFHPIDESSPFRGASPERMASTRDMIVVTFVGIDDTLSATVHARQTYQATQVLFGRRFVDVMGFDERNRRTIDLKRFHDVTVAQLTMPT